MRPATPLGAPVPHPQMARRRRRSGIAVSLPALSFGSLVVLLAAVLVLAMSGPGGAGGTRGGTVASVGAAATPTADATTGPSGGAGAVARVTPTPAATPAVTATASQGATTTSRPSPTATPTPPLRPHPLPTLRPGSSEGFDPERIVVPMGFPFAADVDYRYRDNFLDRRAGKSYRYNHVLARRADGTFQRAHDGTDIYVAMGTKVRSPFRGIVVDPARLWAPWVPERYGRTVIVVSDEPRSRGYAALHAHLSRVDVRIGQRVRRGDVLGRAGNTGNAKDTVTHLHFELRAPFVFRVREAGTVRWLDAVNPYPSLYRADPRHD